MGFIDEIIDYFILKYFIDSITKKIRRVFMTIIPWAYLIANVYPRYIVTRTRGLVTHYGIWFNKRNVWHLRPGVGLKTTSEEEFSEGWKVSYEEIHRENQYGARERFFNEIQQLKDYWIFDNNCEHWAKMVAYGRSESKQVEGWIVLTGLILLFIAATASEGEA